LIASAVLMISIVAGASIAASVLLYQYSNLVADNIREISSASIRSNAQTQAHDVSRIFANKILDVVHNLQVMSTSPHVRDGEVSSARPFFATAQASTRNFTDIYFWVDRDGKLVWASAFSDPDIYRAYIGGDRSNRQYYLAPKATHQFFVSPAIESVDGVLRMYYSIPILENTTSGEEFRGVLVSASNLPDIGAFLKNEIGSSQNSIGMIDSNGVILFSDTKEAIGKNYLAPEIQSRLPAEIKDHFNSFLEKSLKGEEGSGDFTYLGNTTTIAYAPVFLSGSEYAVLYIAAPHRLTTETISLIETQKNFSVLAILAIGAIAVGISVFILTSNRRLDRTVKQRTAQLAQSNESLAESNRQLEESSKKLQAAYEQLSGSEKLQKEFINIAAHELRTPITPILITMHLASQADKGDGSVVLTKDQYEIVTRNAKRLEKLASDILQVTRIEGQRLEIQKEAVDLNKKITDVLADMKGFVPADKDIEFVFEPSKESLIVSADRSKLFEVLSNLIRNAVRFSNDNGKIVITLKKSDDNSSAVVSIRDNGKGIDPSIMPRLFQKFASSPDMGGTGLGLFISKSIIEAHGGRIWAENNSDGKGATFTFTLPLAP
jgi:signal transduction histidine kinase